MEHHRPGQSRVVRMDLIQEAMRQSDEDESEAHAGKALGGIWTPRSMGRQVGFEQSRPKIRE